MITVTASSDRWLRYEGLLVAIIGFGVTRLFVAGTLQTTGSVVFVVGGLASLVVGLALTIYGVMLAVGTFSREYVADVARWCVLGTTGMLLVLILSVSESALTGRGFEVVAESPILVANVVLGGAVGGVLIGNRSAKNRRQRGEVRRRANQEQLVNRILRHEVINAAAIIEGYASQLNATTQSNSAEQSDSEQSPRVNATEIEPTSIEAINDGARRIVQTIDDINAITSDVGATGRIAVSSVLANETREYAAQENTATVTYTDSDDGGVTVSDHRFDLVIRNLLEFLDESANATDITIGLSTSATAVDITVRHDGSEFSDNQRRLLTDRVFPEYDDPTSGFRLQIVRLLVSRADGDITITDEPPDTGLTVTLPREETPPNVASAIELAMPNFGRAVIAGIIAGVAMGGYIGTTGDTMLVIGSLYGVESLVVGWTTHLFHSVVFAVLFAAGCSQNRLRNHLGTPARLAGAGLAWGMMLWLVAAGIIMPIWLQITGITAMLPNFSALGLVAHLLWGGVLGGTYDVLGSIQDWRSDT